MTKITLNPYLRRQLPDLTHPFAICDETGNTLGRFIPASTMAEIQQEPLIDQEEIERRKQNKRKLYSTAEVLAYLETL